MKFSTKDFFNKCDQIRSFLRIWSHLQKKSLMENFFFCAVKSVKSRGFHCVKSVRIRSFPGPNARLQTRKTSKTENFHGAFVTQEIFHRKLLLLHKLYLYQS